MYMEGIHGRWQGLLLQRQGLHVSVTLIHSFHLPFLMISFPFSFRFRWTMPEEYRLWKEKVDALEKKQQEQKLQQSESKQGNSTNLNSFDKSFAPPAKLNKSKSTEDITLSAAVTAAQENKVVYASPAEANEAFKDLLTQKNISTIAKMKEVQDICQSDPRWEALRTMGERKQALAEYQVTPLPH